MGDSESAAPGGEWKTQDVSRRVFIFGSAGVISACAFWGLRRATVAAARPLASDEGPATVTIVQFSQTGEREGTVTIPRVIRTDAEWRKMLPPDSYWVTRHADTERPFSGCSWNLHEHGIFRCIGCDLALFRSETKFDSGTGWPSFWQPIAQENVVDSVDGSLMVVRTAVLPAVRRAPGPRVQRRTGSDGAALLHEFGGDAVREALRVYRHIRPLRLVRFLPFQAERRDKDAPSLGTHSCTTLPASLGTKLLNPAYMGPCSAWVH
jgi:peptide-methionine (R)-S-oxide reductase